MLYGIWFGAVEDTKNNVLEYYVVERTNLALGKTVVGLYDGII